MTTRPEAMDDMPASGRERLAGQEGRESQPNRVWEAKPGSKDEDADDDEKRGRLIHRVYGVFNAEQIDGIPALAVRARELWEVCDAGERIMNNSGADIRYGGDRAYFDPRADYIRLPPREAFTDAPGSYGTSLHELGHWTGHPSGLNRETLTKSRTFGDESYAAEELRAELASMMLAAETGIPHDPGHRGSYVASWLKALKGDKNEIFRAASDASKAVDYLLEMEKSKTVQQPETHAERVTQKALQPSLY